MIALRAYSKHHAHSSFLFSLELLVGLFLYGKCTAVLVSRFRTAPNNIYSYYKASALLYFFCCLP